MAGRPGMLPKLDMGAVKDKDAKEKERTTKFGASMKKLSASIKRGMTPRSRSVSLDPEVSSANNSVTGGSYPNTPQKPDDVADESLDDLKATIREAQALTGIEQPSAPATPEPADSAEALSHTVAQDAVHRAAERADDEEEPAQEPAAAPPQAGTASAAQPDLAPPADVPLPTTMAAEQAEESSAAAPDLAPPADVPLPVTLGMGQNGPVPTADEPESQVEAAPPSEVEAAPAPPPPPPPPLPEPPADMSGPAHAYVEPAAQPDDAMMRVEVTEPPKAAAEEVQPAPNMAPRAAAEQGGLRRHATLRKVLAVASLAGLAYLAKDPVQREWERRQLLLAPPPPPPPPEKGPFSWFK